VAGGSSESDQDRYRDLVLESFSDFGGTVISGGTKSGVAADVGELGAARDSIRTIGYVPADLPGDVQRDTRYDEHRSVPGEDFSPREIIEYWNDLHAAGVPTDQIRLIAFGGGALSAFECCAALALGVPVGIVADGGEPARLLDDVFWNAKGAAGETRLHALESEPESIRSFLSGALEDE
jgi:hypothetical protein